MMLKGLPVFCPSSRLTLLLACILLFSLYFFDRPGAGKSTVSQAAVQLLGGGDVNDVRVGKLNGVHDFLYIYLDLDVCIPQWMRVSGHVIIMMFINDNSSITILFNIISFLQLQLHVLGQLCKRDLSKCRTEM